MTTNEVNLPPPETIGQAVVWTTLPQGQAATDSNTVRVSVLVTPMLSFQETIGVRQSNSTTLSKFADWANWPETLTQSGAELSFEVSFNGGTPVAIGAGYPDLSVLNADYWAAIFDPTVTRVDSAGIVANTGTREDWTSPHISSYQVSAVHDLASSLYSTYAVGSTDAPGATGTGKPVVLSKGLTPANPKTAAAFAYNNILTVPTALKTVLDFHQTVAPASSSSAPPVADFHSAVSALGAYPEILRYLGLLFPLEITVPAHLVPDNATSTFTVTIIPRWTPSFTGNVNVSPPTRCGVVGDGGGHLVSFLSQPYGSDYQAGMLTLGAGVDESSDTQFTVVDVDVDGVTQSLSALNAHIAASLAPYSDTEVQLNVTLPALRSVGPTLVWNNWGENLSAQAAAGTPQSLSSLTYRQQAIQTAIVNHVENGTAIPALYTEDITKGWRVDVLPSPTTAVLNPPWQSLHWRLASFAMGPRGAYQIPASPATVAEAWVSPSVVYPPVAEGESVPTIAVHEAIVRWDGWSLSAPRPGGQINEDGTGSPAVGNPMPPTSLTDVYGNINPQFSAEYSIPPAGLPGYDPSSGNVTGVTGLPRLRFGQSYQYRARAVDLGGWSVPANSVSNAVSTTVVTTHCRWEPVRPPIILPTAPLTPGEGVLTMVIRDSGSGGRPPVPPVSNARWLFPPRVHEAFAEEHGFCDSPVGGDFDTPGLPNPAVYPLLAQYNDGSLLTLPGIQQLGAGTSAVPYLVLPLPETGHANTTVTWLPDPAAFGIAIGGVGPFTSGSFDPYPVIPPPPTVTGTNSTSSQNFLDTWAPTSGSNVKFQAWLGWTAAWPNVAGKVLEVVSSTTRPTAGSITQPAGWSAYPGGDGPYPRLTMTVVPGSVYRVLIGSVYSAIMGSQYYSPAGMWGIQNWINQNSDIPPRFKALLDADPFMGLVQQVTPASTLLVVYAVLLPQRETAFSSGVQFSRTYGDTSVTIADDDFVIDYPSTSTVTFTSTWTDPLDDPTNPANDPATDTITTTQQNLVATVNNVYPSPVAASPLVPATVKPQTTGLPFGAIGGNTLFDSTDPGGPGDITPGLEATQRIGDTKHHHATYSQVAAGRFGEFFAETTTSVIFTGTGTVTLNAKGVAPNLVSVVLPATAKDAAVTVPPTLYTVVGPAGTVQLNSADASVRQGYVSPSPGNPGSPGTSVTLSGTPLEVTWVPPDTLAGADYTTHILSSVTPPPLKVANVVPAWSLSTSGTVSASNFALNRTGNILRVYLERPWYVTGANELVGVIVAQASGTTPGLPPNVDPLAVSLIGFDPISVPNPETSAYSQTQLRFVTNTSVPTTSTLVGGQPCKVEMSNDPTADIYQVWGYEPQFDPKSNLWFVDVQLDVSRFPAELPPGYFLQLALVRFQPYSIPPTSAAGSPVQYNWTSPLTLLTYAQPLTNRAVFVQQGPNKTLSVEVLGPGYYGWRSVRGGHVPDVPVRDVDNTTATHPNSDGKGSPATSTMVVEVQEYNPAGGFSGDFGWSTVTDYTVALTPKFTDAALIGWDSHSTSRSGGIELPKTTNPLRLCISELDYYGPVGAVLPSTIDTSVRRTFVVHVPVSARR
jgi:hypothetical protein